MDSLASGRGCPSRRPGCRPPRSSRADGRELACRRRSRRCIDSERAMAAADSTEPQARTRGRLCGPLRLEIDGVDVARGLPGIQAAALLCYLLASPNRAADSDELIALLWPERPPRDPQGALRPILSRLRRSVEPAAIEGRDRVSLVLPDPVWMDVGEATRCLEAARAAARDGLWEGVRNHSE